MLNPFPHIQSRLYPVLHWTKYVSVDLEFDERDKPTILGISAEGEPVSVGWNKECEAFLRNIPETVKLIGHNVIDADKPIIESYIGPTNLARWDDTIILHYLCNADFCNMAQKDQDTGEQFTRGIGLLNLWSMASLYTDLPQWKMCRGEMCEGPCPKHDVFGYNGIDAYAVDVAYPKLIEEMREKKIPDKLYQDTKQIMALTRKMREQGVKINVDYIRNLAEEFKKRKEKLFYTTEKPKYGKRGQVLKYPDIIWNSPFNPNSPKQIIEYFESCNIPVKSSAYLDLERAFRDLSDDNGQTGWLGKLIDYKLEGKDIKAWFDAKYIDSSNLAHPRFNPLGASTGRFSSSGPNFQNIPKVGFGKRIRKGIIPRDEGLVLVKADYKQIEFRLFLWYACRRLGKDVPTLPDDVFDLILERAGHLFEDAAKKMKRTIRDVAKRVVHADDYMEGLIDIKENQVNSLRIRNGVRDGYIIIPEGWNFSTGTFGFTGVNLSKSLFGKASRQDRKLALQIQQAFWKQFPEIYELKKSLIEHCERGYIQSASGRYLKLHGQIDKRMKEAAAFLGQGASDYCQEAMIKYDNMGEVPLINLHDELTFERDVCYTDDEHREFMNVMSEPSKIFEGFSCPVQIQKGRNWLECEVI